MNSVQKLYDYLNLKLQNPLQYEDLNNLCYSLFCTLDILPDNLQSLILTKEVLAEVLIKLAKEKDIADCPTAENWIEYLRKSIIKDKWPNIENARLLLNRN